MVENGLEERFLKEKSKMDQVFKGLIVKNKEKNSKQFLEMASNYYKDSQYFYEKGDVIRAFEAIVISWAYVDAGLKTGFFKVPESLNAYFTL